MTNDKSDQLTNQPTNQPADQPATFRLTVETGLWVLVGVVALALRLAHLDAASLSGREAHEAMLAWRAVTGQGMPEADYSPLLFAGNALLFTLFGAGDGLARLWPALSGGALALTPFLLRQRIGRVGALVAGLYLALSPTSLFASRQLDGAVMAAAGGMALLGGLVRFSDTGRRAWLTLSAGGLALAVTSSPSAYGLLLALGLAWLILSWIWPGGEVDLPHLSRLPHWSLVIGHWSLFALAFSTGLGWNPAGLGVAGDLLLAWIARFGPASNPVVSPLVLGAVYEPLALVFGLGGLAWGGRRGHRFGVLLGLWAGLGGLLLSLMPGRTPLDVLWVVLPLALLTGVAVESLVWNLREGGEWLSEGLYSPVVVILWVYFYLALVRYAVSGISVDLALALLAAVLQALLGTVFALAMRFATALRAVAVGTGVVLLAATLSAGWGVAYARLDDPRELLAREPTAGDVRDLVQTLRDLSWRRTGMPTTLPFTFEAVPDSVLAWSLRDFSAARRVERLDKEDVGKGMEPVLVTPRRDLGELGLTDVPYDADEVGYVGRDFVLRRSWNPLEVACTWEWPPQCHLAVRWLLFRHTPSPPAADQWVALWLLEGGEDGE
jgi:uncharacterized protein (TIGR03663 family)